MMRIHILLALAILLACGQVQAQGRPNELTSIEREAERGIADLDAATRAKRMAELDAWLRRLVGRFRIDGSVVQPAYGNLQSTKAQGNADCVLVGAGPGVQCMINASWASLYAENGPPGTGARSSAAMSNAFNTLKPMMMLFGLDPDSVGIQLYTVDQTGSTWLGRLIYSKNDLIYNSHCIPNTEHCIEFAAENACDGDFTHCFDRIIIVARPGDKLIKMDFTIPSGTGGIGLRLHREARVQKEKAR